MRRLLFAVLIGLAGCDSPTAPPPPKDCFILDWQQGVVVHYAVCPVQS